MNFLSLFSGIISLVNKFLDWKRERQLMNTGRELQKSEDKRAQEKIARDAVASNSIPVSDDELYRD